jgi:YVTN family beta-propeller protein
MTVSGVPLYSSPKIVIQACERAQTLTDRTVLCPTLLPRPTLSSSSEPGLPPQPIGVAATNDPRLMSYGTGPGSVLLSFMYNAPYENDPSKNRPERFLHFEVYVRGKCCGPPQEATPVVLGGKSGLLVRAGRPGAYFANHVRYFWHQHGADYVATLHEFGAGTTALLGALVAGLEPVESVATVEAPAPAKSGATVPIPGMTGPVDVVAADGSVWTASIGDVASAYQAFAWPGHHTGPGLQRFDPRTLRPEGRPIRLVLGKELRRLGLTSVDWRPSGLASGFGRMWTVVTYPRPARLFGIDPATGQIRARFRMSFPPTAGDVTGIAAAGGALWVSQYGPLVPKHVGEFGGTFTSGSVWRIDPSTGAVTARIKVGAGAVEVAGTPHAVWAADYLDDSVSRIDSSTSRVVATIPVGAGPASIAATSRAVWVTNSLDGTVSRIDPDTNRVVARIRVGMCPMGVTASATGVWVTNYQSDTASVIDPGSNRVIGTLPTGRGPIGIAENTDRLWVTNDLDATLTQASLGMPGIG